MISSASDKKIDELWSTNREQSEKMKKVEKGREKMDVMAAVTTHYVMNSPGSPGLFSINAKQRLSDCQLCSVKQYIHESLPTLLESQRISFGLESGHQRPHSF